MSQSINSLPPISTPWSVRYRVLRDRAVPLVAMIAVLITVMALWRQYQFQVHGAGIVEGNRSLMKSVQPGITSRDQLRANYWSAMVEDGTRVEEVANAAVFARTRMRTDAASSFAMRFPPVSGIQPGELEDILLERTFAEKARSSLARVARGSEAPRLAPASGSSAVITYTGMSDASAGVALDSDLLVVADDEESILRVYDRNGGGAPLQELNLTAYLRGGRGSKEADLEGSARMGGRIYWISSHGRNAEGKRQASRYRFFATQVALKRHQLVLEPEGLPYKRLLEDLITAPQLAGLGLEQAAQLAPKAAGGLNIEGLCPSTDGSLLIGFRNPLPGGKALVVPLLNPHELPFGGKARFGRPQLLDLGGLGIRSLEHVHGNYYVLAGPVNGQGKPRLFVWSGGDHSPSPVEVASLSGLNPEAITVYEWDGRLWFHVLSDDGAVKVGGIEAKRLKDPAQKTFRGVSIPLPELRKPSAQHAPSRERETQRDSERTGDLARAPK